MSDFLYVQFYCEENIWQLWNHSEFANKEGWVVFISNLGRCCPFWNQKAAEGKGGAVWWDYHVIALEKSDSGPRVWDLDTELTLPISLEKYLDLTFPTHQIETIWFAPRFRLVKKENFLEQFTSDRSHMKSEDGKWQQPPPDWECIVGEEVNNLEEYLDFTQEKRGPLFTRSQLIRRSRDLP